MQETEKKHVGRLLGLMERRAETGVSLDNVMDFAALSAESLRDSVGRIDPVAFSALTEIGDEISAMKAEISRLQFQDVKHQKIPEAGRELDAIVEATETATHTIMEAAEAIMEADSSDRDKYEGVVTDRVMEIFEACSFQDITGQRIAKVVRTIETIDARVSEFVERLQLIKDGSDCTPDVAGAEETEDERRRRELILHGPQLDGEGVDQNTVDALLEGGADGSSQSDIDRLFD
ncbi:MAG: protein phosphatase CheZ [Pseudomonadota bacterium]